MKTTGIFVMALLGIVWIALVVAMLRWSPASPLYKAFIVVASGIIIFMPIYKKYFKDGKDRN